MATPAAVLQVMVDANTTEATTKLTKVDKQMEAMNAQAKKGIEIRLGATLDPKAMDAYSRRISEIQRKNRERQAFKAELGANYSAAGFNAYSKALGKSE